MDRTFDYAQKILLAVEFAAAPQRLPDMPAGYSVFKRMSIPEVMQAFDDTQSWFVQLLAGRKFHHVLEEHMGYWERRVPAGKQCFVHYAIGADDVITAAFERLKRSAGEFLVLGIYHVEPQCSAYPFGFPRGTTPSHWTLGETYPRTDASIFWFNFFPQQPHLFAKTFAVRVTFQTSQLRERGECNLLVAADGKGRHLANGVDDFAQVNLNRFTSLAGYFASAHAAGRNTFTADAEYLWYGMLLRNV